MNQTAALQALTHIENGNNREAARVLRAILEGGTNVPSAAQATAIADISNSASGTQIATAVNGILAVLRAQGAIATA
jgi:hypothetical protein